ncbi:unnamed protein product [Ectocarpus sp. 4 AP-2014]
MRKNAQPMNGTSISSKATSLNNRPCFFPLQEQAALYQTIISPHIIPWCYSLHPRPCSILPPSQIPRRFVNQNSFSVWSETAACGSWSRHGMFHAREAQEPHQGEAPGVGRVFPQV